MTGAKVCVVTDPDQLLFHYGDVIFAQRSIKSNERITYHAAKMTDLNEVKLEALLDIINSSARQAIAEYKKTGHGVPGVDSTTFHPLDLATDTLALRKAIRLLEGACHQLSAILAPPQHTIYNVSTDHT